MLNKKWQNFCIKQTFANIAIWVIVFYQKAISPWLPSVCRFSPSCSQYGKIAYKNLGFFSGTYYTIKRILHCHPYYKGNLNDMPPNNKKDL